MQSSGALVMAPKRGAVGGTTLGPVEGQRQMAGAVCVQGTRVCRPYLHSGLKLPSVWGLFSFKTIISWSSRRKASRLVWCRKVLRSLAFSGLRSALYLDLISRNGS